MQQPASSAPSPTFAGMLAALAAPGQKKPPARDLDGLEDDIATLSYERALRAHGRYRTPEVSDRALTQPSELDGLRIFEAEPEAEAVSMAAAREPAPVMQADAEPEGAHPDAHPDAHQDFRAAGRNLKCASITIRLSKAEVAQLRGRAAEAGLTVSAYLRSCTLEAESLRAMVKDTLAQLRAETAKPRLDAEVPERRSRLGWLRRLWPHADGRQQVAGA